jgi:hypothetical protein
MIDMMIKEIYVKRQYHPELIPYNFQILKVKKSFNKFVKI